MHRSGPRQAELFKDENHATAHNIDGTIMPFENVDNLGGAGAIVSTGADMARWLQMLLAKGHFEGQQLLKPTTVQEIFSASMVQGPGGPLQDPNDAAGLGCETYDFLGFRVVEKNGAVDGFRSIVTLVPERQIGIAIVANKQLTVFPEAIRAEFLERYLGPRVETFKPRFTTSRPPGMGWCHYPRCHSSESTSRDLSAMLATIPARPMGHVP